MRGKKNVRLGVRHGDTIETMQKIEGVSVDAAVTDSPYELGFMGKRWDASGISYSVEMWSEVLRILKPGGYLLAFGGTRTCHRLTCAIEDAGFEIQDSIDWITGQGFPKSLDVGRSVDMELCESPGRHFMRKLPPEGKRKPGDHVCPETPEGNGHRGEGTALKPAHEPIVVARKPLVGTVAVNVLEYGTGGINVDACRVGVEKVQINTWNDGAKPFGGGAGHEYTGRESVGRWPPNIVLTHRPDCRPVGKRKVKGDLRGDCQGRRPSGFGNVGAESGDAKPNARVYGDELIEVWECVEGCPVAEMDRQSGVLKSGMMKAGQRRKKSKGKGGYHDNFPDEATVDGTYGDTGGASRFFPCFRYQKKASTKEKNAGLPEGFRNNHPTVKPVELMRWLVRLVTPPGGLVLDPFMGSGTTGVACALEGFRFIGIDKDPESIETARFRISHAFNQAKAACEKEDKA